MIGRELTKINESLVLKPTIEQTAELREKGEVVVVVDKVSNDSVQVVDLNGVVDIFYRLTNLAAINDNVALEIVSQRFNLPKPRVKNIVKKARIETKRRQGRLP
jgi:16S rRNA C1402 (ribose-2'-O) methylase RsmI